jgi:hypothetical protein
MTSSRSEYVINIERLPGSENASRFDGHEHGQASRSLSTATDPARDRTCTATLTKRRS